MDEASLAVDCLAEALPVGSNEQVSFKCKHPTCWMLAFIQISKSCSALE